MGEAELTMLVPWWESSEGAKAASIAASHAENGDPDGGDGTEDNVGGLVGHGV